MLKKILSFEVAVVFFVAAHHSVGAELFANKKYVCPPCYHVESEFDTQTYHKDGQCSVCGMNLIEKPFSLGESSPEIHFGSGNFQFLSQRSNAPSPITVFYHKPKAFKPDSKIIMVIPGAGRNAWDYRDSWVDLSERYNVLVVSPYYPENDYNYAAYHLAGIVSDIEFRNYSVSKAEGRINKYYVKDEDIITKPVTPLGLWLFRDFDDIFDQVVQLSGSNRSRYDLFGHSAGGQILHRMAVFHSGSKADRIIASNSGTYTSLQFENNYPLGIKGMKFNKNDFGRMFSRKLTLLVGEQDNAEETRGTMLHTPALDKQGLGRLSRGKSFYKESRAIANEMGIQFNWGLCLVEKVGHEYQKMGVAAAKILYGGRECRTKMRL